MQNTNHLTLEKGFDSFVKKCKVKNLSTRTIEYYIAEYERFTKYLDKESNLSVINSDVIDDYIFWLRNNTKANDITIATYLRAIRAIFYYFMKLGYTPKFDITIPKAVKKVKETYTDSELMILLKKPNIHKCTFTEYKTWVYVNYLLATGNRISTVVNVKIKDLDFENQLIKLTTTKNKRQQIIPMANTLAPILIEYLSVRGGEEDDYVKQQDITLELEREGKLLANDIIVSDLYATKVMDSDGIVIIRKTIA